MKITEKQLQLLLVVLKDSLEITHGVFGIDVGLRRGLFNDIINQQSDEIKEIE